MKAAKIIVILLALPLLLTCELFSGPNDRENTNDPLSPSYAGWHGVKAVESAGDVGMFASLRVSGANLFISHFDSLSQHMRFASSADAGLTWANKRIDSSADIAGNPSAIAIRQKGSLFDITAVYQDGQYLRAMKSTDSGANWINATTQPHVATIVLQHCSLAAGTGADDAYYASYYVQAGTADLYFAKSVAGSANWSAGTVVDSLSDDCGSFNSIAVSGLAVFIAYRNRSTGVISMINSTTGGTPFSTPVYVGGTSTGVLGGTSVVTTDGWNVYVVYFDGNDLGFAKSSNGGGSFSAALSVSSNGGISTSMAILGNRIYVSHFDTTGDLRFTRSDNLGATWYTLPTPVDTGLGTNFYGKSTSIAVDGTNVYIAYYDATNGDLKIARSIDNGDNW